MTLYDEITGSPYCLKVSNGAMVSAVGECSAAGFSSGTTTSQSISSVVSSNTATSSADTEPPVITLQGNATSTLNVGDSYVDLGATVTDNIDHNLGVRVTGLVDTSKAGIYTLYYDATDSAGNKATQLTRVVTVVGQSIQPDSSTSTSSSTTATSTTQ